MASSVPDLHFDNFVSHIQVLHRELNADGGILRQEKVVVNIARYDVGLPNATVT